MKLINQIEKDSSFIAESVLMISVAAILITLFTYSDIITHDFYTLPWVEMCYVGNTNPDCLHEQELTNCPKGGTCIEGLYAQMIQVQMLVLGGLLAAIKLGFAKVARRAINLTRITSAAIFGSLPIILLGTGLEDFLYFVSRNMPIPPTLPWLTNTGLFPIIDQKFLHLEVATSMSLYVIVAIGFGFVSFLLFANMRIYKMAHYSTAL